MSLPAVNYQKLFEDSPLARLVITRAQKEHFFVEHANNVAIKYFCPDVKGDCATIDGMYMRDFLDSTNTTHILQALEVCYNSRVPISIQVLPKNSETMHVQSFMLSPVINDNDEILWIDMQAKAPVTEQASVERERDDALSMFTTVFDVSDVGITVTDHHGRFVRVNDAFVNQTGWNPIDLMGEELTKIIPDDEHEIAWKRHTEALNQTKKNFGEIRIVKKCGTEMNVMVTSVMMELSNGRSFRITTIMDQGIGIPQERIAEVLEPFGQVSDPSVNKGQGTGLGLPIAKAMMDMHDGELKITSEKDRGTIVTCLFPETRVK